ncbi:lysin A [Arthrobacter phage Wheelbite]|uniref:Lysin A n=1 Tax=Arthrobacter phage Wheelbite TaxID=2015873 RepID=A0A222ZHH1_9CAUD|nr:endolysin [Arthrobacter phage Wheelbite]ASR84166.1 lysin A [Arthrobacter phage Wheelbite]
MSATPEAPAVAPESEWGGPTFKTFKKRYVRIVRAGDSTAWVHAEIADIVREIFLAAEAPYGELAAYDAESTNVAATYGTYLPIPWTLELQRWGFGMHGDGIVFEGSIDDARALSEQAAVLAAEREIAASAPAVPEDPDTWAAVLPGARNLRPGDRGDDVQFIQFLGGLTPDGLYGPKTEEFVKYLRSKWGLGIPTVTLPEGYAGPTLDFVPLVDAEFWGGILPRKTLYSMGQGDAGFKIRVLQSALAAADWAPAHLVSGRFGVETSKAVRRMQANFGLRVTGRVRQAEWLALVDFRLQS